MQTNRLWPIGAGIVIVAIIALGWFLGISPKLAEAASTAAQALSVETQNTAQEAVIAQLEKDSADLPAREAELAALQREVPLEANAADYITELNTIAVNSGVAITTITTADGVGFVPAAVTIPETSPSSDPESPASIAWAIRTQNAAEAATLSSSQFIVIPMTIGVTGSRDQVLQFIYGLQHGDGRLFLLQTLALEADDSDDAAGAYNGTIGGNVYVLLDPSKIPVAATTDTDTDTEADG
jgi:Tfp pilus assembly protein PilO